MLRKFINFARIDLKMEMKSINKFKEIAVFVYLYVIDDLVMVSSGFLLQEPPPWFIHPLGSFFLLQVYRQGHLSYSRCHKKNKPYNN